MLRTVIVADHYTLRRKTQQKREHGEAKKALAARPPQKLAARHLPVASRRTSVPLNGATLEGLFAAVPINQRSKSIHQSSFGF